MEKTSSPFPNKLILLKRTNLEFSTVEIDDNGVNSMKLQKKII